MRPERWPGEPLIERLTLEEKQEVQACYVRTWAGARRRRQFEERRQAEAKAARDARRATHTVARAPASNWLPYQGERKPHPEGHRPYKKWEGRTRLR